MRLWYLSHRRPAKAEARLGIRTVSLEPLLFAHIMYESRRRVRPKMRHLAPLDGPGWMAVHACLKNKFMEYEKYHYLMTWLN